MAQLVISFEGDYSYLFCL